MYIHFFFFYLVRLSSSCSRRGRKKEKERGGSEENNIHKKRRNKYKLFLSFKIKKNCCARTHELSLRAKECDGTVKERTSISFLFRTGTHYHFPFGKEIATREPYRVCGMRVTTRDVQKKPDVKLFFFYFFFHQLITFSLGMCGGGENLIDH